MRIEITGPIGSAKTALAEALASQPGWQIASEAPERIPFWAETYSGIRSYQFEKDVAFLLFHGVSVRERQLNSGGALVCDFSLVQDFAYAQMGQDAAELEVYGVIHRYVSALCGDPGLIINLRCSTATLLTRIMARGRDPERGVTHELLDQLVEHIDALLTARPKQLPVVEIDSEAIDFTQAPALVIAQVVPLLRGVTT